MTVPARLPRSAQEIADVIGRDATLRLIGKLPRCLMRDKRYPAATVQRVMLYVPASLPADHQLVRMIGYPAAKRLSDAFGGEILYPAACNEVYRAWRDKEIFRMAEEGLSAVQIADVVGLTDSRVYAMLRSVAAENPHVELKVMKTDDVHSENQQ